MATTIIDRLITKVEFDNDTSGLKSATRSISSFKTNIVAVLAPVVALFSGGLFINSISNAADEMIKFADATGIAVEDLQDLEFAVQRQGGSISGLRSSITNMSKALGELSLDKGLAKDVFEALGLSAFDAGGKVKSSTKSLLELNVAFQTLSKSEQVGFGKKLGLDIGTIQLLQTAPRELQALIAQSKEFGRVSEAEARQAAEFNDQLTNLNTSISRIAQSIGLSVLPALTEFVADLVDVVSFIRENSEFFTLFGEILIGVAGGFILISTGIRTAAAASLASAAAFLANPLFLIPTAIIAISAGLALLIEDFLAWRAGADSAFGGFFDFADKKIDKFLDGLRKIREFLINLVAPIDRFFGIINDGGLDFDVDSLTNRFSSGLDKVSNFVGLGDQGRAVSNRTTTIGDVNVIVNAPNANSEEIAANVGQTLNEQLRSTAQDFDSSFRR